MDASTAMILANAVYFKGKWANEFDPKATTNRPFHIAADNVKEVPTMYRKGNYKYAELPEYDAKCIELPYAVMLLSQIFQILLFLQIFEKCLIKRSRYFVAFHYKCVFYFGPSQIYELNFYYRAEQRGQHGDHSTQ